jgi:hypothetical protein
MALAGRRSDREKLLKSSTKRLHLKGVSDPRSIAARQPPDQRGQWRRTITSAEKARRSVHAQELSAAAAGGNRHTIETKAAKIFQL